MVAHVNGKRILRSELDSQTERMFMQYADKIPPNQQAQVKESLQKNALENLINQQLLTDEAEKEGIKAEEQAVEDQYNEITKQFSTPEELKNALSSMGTTEEDFKKEMEQGLTIEALLDAKIGGLKIVTDEEVEDYYKNNPDSFNSPEQLKASHILISADPNENPEERAEKRIKLSALLGELEKGADFAKLAQENSSCGSAKQGGDLGFFHKGKMVPAFEDAAFQLNVGEVSDIVETQFGFHVIKLTERKEAQAIPLEQVRDNVKDFLNKQRGQEAISEYISKLRGTATVEYTEGYQP